MLWGSTGFTGSPDLGVGTTPSDLPDGPKVGQSGPAPAPVPRSLRREEKNPALIAVVKTLYRMLDGLATSYAAYAATNGLPTSGTYGRKCGDCSGTEDLQFSLGNKLHQRMGVSGSLLFALRWKYWVTPLGPPICALRAAGHRTSGKDFGSWPSPKVSDFKGADCARAENRTGNRHAGDDLSTVALTSWATPATRDYRFANLKPYQERGGGKKGEQLNNQAVHLASWPTPITGDAHLSSTPEAAQRRLDEGKPTVSRIAATLSGPPAPGSPAGTGSGAPQGQLNPQFPLWLMGYPQDWLG